MNNFGTLLGFELKKLLINKVTILLLVLFAVFLFGVTMLEYTVISPENRFVSEREAELEGMKLDDELITKTTEEAARYGSLTEIDGNSLYYHVSRYINRALGTYLTIPDLSVSVSAEELTGESFYRNREILLDYLHDYFQLDDMEKTYWHSKESEISKPFTWQANYGISAMRGNFGMTTALSAITIGICLSGIFASESRYRTDSLIMCTKAGVKTLPLIKILAGEIFSLIVSTMLLVSVQLPHILFNGLHGIGTACQLIVPFTSCPCTSGKLLLIYTGLFFLASLLIGAVTILLSRILNHMIAAGGMICFTVLADLFLTIPPNFRILSQLRYLTPLQVLINSSITDPRLVRIGSMYLTVFQASAILYTLLLVICLSAIFPGKNREK